jgi:hypothetical protein
LSYTSTHASVYSTTGLGGGGFTKSLTVVVTKLTPVTVCVCVCVRVCVCVMHVKNALGDLTHTTHAHNTTHDHTHKHCTTERVRSKK